MSATLGIADLNFASLPSGELFNLSEVANVRVIGSTLAITLASGVVREMNTESPTEATAQLALWTTLLTSVTTALGSPGGTLPAAGSLQFGAKATYADGQTEVLTDADGNIFTFEWDVSGTNTPGVGNHEVDISGVTTALDVAYTFWNVMYWFTGYGATDLRMIVGPYYYGFDTIPLTDITYGTSGNVALGGDGGGTVRTGMSGGV